MTGPDWCLVLQAAKGKGKGRGRDQKGKKASGSTSVKAPSEGPRRSTRNSKEAGSKEAEQINAGVNNPVEEENDNVGENADMEDDMDLGNDDVGGEIDGCWCWGSSGHWRR